MSTQPLKVGDIVALKNPIEWLGENQYNVTNFMSDGRVILQHMEQPVHRAIFALTEIEGLPDQL
jgi:hypothetical protein